MLFSPRASTRETAQLCQRLAISLDAGIDVRKIWADEASRATGLTKSYYRAISEGINQGQSLTKSLKATSDYFPQLFYELTAVGEETGKLEVIYKRLAEQYNDRLKMRRLFLTAIAWPMIELVFSIIVIGLYIWLIGTISSKPIDLLGFGLYGTRGLIIYCAFISSVAAVIWFVIHAINRGLAWTRLIQYIVLRIPAIGKMVEKLCLATFSWTLQITYESGMEIRRAVKMSFRSTGNARYIDCIPEVDRAIASGVSLHQAFREARCFPQLFLDAVAVGEQSGKLSETMANQSRIFEDQARMATNVLTMLAGVAVFILIALLILSMIFRMWGSYMGLFKDLL